MQFNETGPDIPSHLLEQQALGNVIFFCGAGISMPAGLLGFRALTERVIAELGAEKASLALTQGESLDQVFRWLVREFDREEIDRQIFAALNIRRARTLENHKSVLDLSQSAAGVPQIVTTNFDRLFERAVKGLRVMVPPGLPDIELNQPINGLVYLHGRLIDPRKNEVPAYIITSSDFGRAYLADGWAAKFVKALRERYTVVLIGYSADDPPMRYLLEGLNARDGVAYNSPIYAFSDRSTDEAEEVWQDRGVTPICYDPREHHSALWTSMAKWAEASRDVDSWHESILGLAKRSPRELRPFERGQVVQLVSTSHGAKVFADADPPAVAEWLCVFDPNIRYGKPRKDLHDENPREIDPLDFYGLSNDPVRPDEDDKRSVPEGAENPLFWQTGDGFQPERVGLYGWSPIWQSPIPTRLHHLARWIGSRCHEPSAIWWAAGAQKLSPHIIWFISNRVRGRTGEPMPESAQLIWNHFLDAHETAGELDRGDRWFDFEGLLAREGWTLAVKRFFENLVRPRVEIRRPSLSAPHPPVGNWQTLKIRDVVDLRVATLDRHGERGQFPEDATPDLASILRRSLIDMSNLLTDLGHTFWHAPTLYPTERAGQQHHGRKATNFLWFKRTFDKLKIASLRDARSEVRRWPADEALVFSKLRLWAAADSDLFSAHEAHEIVTGLEPEVLWDSYNQRELLSLLRQRWSEFSRTQRRSLERLLEDGPPKWDHESDKEYAERKSATSASNLRWLELQGCELSRAASRALAKLKKGHPKWSDHWAESADESFESRGGVVQEVSEFGDLYRYPVNEIVSVARARTVDPFSELKHYRPFRGLVESYPFKALSALRVVGRKGEYPIDFWTDLLSKWPDSTPIRLRRLVAYSIGQLPSAQFLKLRYYSGYWLKKHFRAFYRSSRRDALRIFDDFLESFQTAPAPQTGSSLGNTSIGGVVQPRSEVSINKAINSPIGHLTEALWTATCQKAKKQREMNGNLATRFKRLVDIPGHGAGHAVAVLTMRLGWIEYCYEDWMRTFLLPMFAPSHPHAEAAWHGLAYNGNGLTSGTWQYLKAPMMEVLKGTTSWRLDPHEHEQFAKALVSLARPSENSDPLFTFEEIKGVIVELSDEARGQVLWALATSLQKHGQWNEFVQPFINEAWPRQTRFRSAETTRGFVRIAEGAKEHFPAAVEAILRLVRPIPHADMFTYRISKDRDDSDNIAKDFPVEAVKLLGAITPDDRSQMPFSLGDALEALAEIDIAVMEMPEFRRLKALLD